MEEAIEQAKKLDEHMERTGKPVGPLHGLPISIKVSLTSRLDSLVKMDLTAQMHMPITGRWESKSFMCHVVRSEKDSAAVAILRSLGAVFYCKTNCPQSGLSLETFGSFGRTVSNAVVTSKM